MPSRCSHSPHSDGPMSPIPIASVTVAPQPCSSRARKAGSPPPGSPATSRRVTLEPGRSTPRSAATSSRWAPYDGVSATISGFSSSIAFSSRSLLPVPTGMWARPIRSNAASAAPATNGPAPYVLTMRSPGAAPEAA